MIAAHCVRRQSSTPTCDPSGKRAAPSSSSREIFASTATSRASPTAIAADGYVVHCAGDVRPVQKGFDVGYSREDIAKGREVRGKVTNDMALKDAQAAVNEAAKSGQSGHRRLCWGGW